jgi:hypothetical protein
MFAKSVAVFTLLFAATASALRVDTPPKLTTCQDIDWTYGEGAPKYLLALVHGDNPCGDAIMEFDETSAEKQTWKVNVPAGTQVQAVLIDSSGTEAWGGIVKVEDGDHSCLAGVQAVSPPPAPSSTSTTAKPSTTSKPTIPTGAGAGVANVEAGANNNETGAAASSFVISSAAVAGVIGAAALLF